MGDHFLERFLVAFQRKESKDRPFIRFLGSGLGRFFFFFFFFWKRGREEFE